MRTLDPAPTEQDIATSVLREFDGTDVLEAAACLGESFTINDLSRAAGRSSTRSRDDPARTDRGIIRRRAATEPSSVFLDPSGSYSFVHERVASAVRSQVAPKPRSTYTTASGALLLSDDPGDVIVAA